MSQALKSLGKKYSIVVLKKQPYLPKLHKNIITLKQKDQFTKCQQCKKNNLHACYSREAETILVSSLARVKTENNIQLDERRENIKNKIKQRLIKKMEKCWEGCSKQQTLCINHQKNREIIKPIRMTQHSKKLNVEQQIQANKTPRKVKLSPLRASKKRRQTVLEKSRKQQKFRIEGTHMRNFLDNEDSDTYNFVQKYSSIDSDEKFMNKKNSSEMVRSMNNKKLKKLENKHRSISVLKIFENQSNSKQLLQESNGIEPWNIQIYQ